MMVERIDFDGRDEHERLLRLGVERTRDVWPVADADADAAAYARDHFAKVAVDLDDPETAELLRRFVMGVQRDPTNLRTGSPAAILGCVSTALWSD